MNVQHVTHIEWCYWVRSSFKFLSQHTSCSMYLRDYYSLKKTILRDIMNFTMWSYISSIVFNYMLSTEKSKFWCCFTLACFVSVFRQPRARRLGDECICHADIKSKHTKKNNSPLVHNTFLLEMWCQNNYYS